VNILRRLSLWRLALLCGLVLALGASATALALAVGSGPTPPPKALAIAVHDALTAPAPQGVSAQVKLTNHLLEGAGLASGDGEASQLSSSPLVSGATGRLWIANDGRVRLELQAERGDTQILYDRHTLSMYDAASNTLYRYTVPAGQTADPSKPSDEHHEPPTVAKIEESISDLRKHANVSGATPTDVAGQPAYTVRISPNEGGSMIGGGELSFDAAHGAPLRAAIYSSTTPSPVIELAATKISYGPVDSSVFEFTPPPDAKIEEVKPPAANAKPEAQGDANHPKLTTKGHGIAAVEVLESQAKAGAKPSSTALTEGLPKVKINGVSATELATSLGTLLSFERAGVRYVLLGSVTPAAIEAVARGL
jgi:outer membrane lipoprotein-sorting protein